MCKEQLSGGRGSSKDLAIDSDDYVGHADRTPGVPARWWPDAPSTSPRMALLGFALWLTFNLTVQALTPDGLRNLGPSVEHMAAVEGLDAHKRAVSLRLAALSR